MEDLLDHCGSGTHGEYTEFVEGIRSPLYRLAAGEVNAHEESPLGGGSGGMWGQFSLVSDGAAAEAPAA